MQLYEASVSLKEDIFLKSYFGWVPEFFKNAKIEVLF